MTTPADTGLTVLDLTIGLAVVLSVLLGLRRGRGLLAALATGALVIVGCWLACAFVLDVGPASWQRSVAASRFAVVTGPPVGAVHSVVDHH